MMKQAYDGALSVPTGEATGDYKYDERRRRGFNEVADKVWDQWQATQAMERKQHTQSRQPKA